MLNSVRAHAEYCTFVQSCELMGIALAIEGFIFFSKE